MSNISRIVILLESGRSFDRQLLQGIGQYSRLHGKWSLHIVSEGLGRLMPPATLWNGSGVICRLRSRRLARAIIAAKVPFVTVESFGKPIVPRRNRRNARTFVDMEGIIQLAMDHFFSRKINHFAFVSEATNERTDIWNDGLASRFNGNPKPLFTFPSNGASNLPWMQERHLLAGWLQRLPKPIGVLACDDERGLQVLEVCRTLGLRVPDEVAVIGVGNDELLCTMGDPPLSSVALNAVNGGYRAAHALDQLMRRSTNVTEQLVVEPIGVVARSSTDAGFGHDADVNAARSAIRRQRLQDVSINEIARSLDISRRKLEIKFRRQTGKTLLEEIQDVRLTRAKMILQETDLPIAKVAYLSGFRSASYLVTVFGKKFGVTPAKYRADARALNSSEPISAAHWNSKAL